MSEDKKPPPDEYSAFKELLDKIAKVPKEEIERSEKAYEAERLKKKA